MSPINAEWHKANRMPPRATLDQRIKWHLEHAKECACREIPPKLQAGIKRRVPMNDGGLDSLSAAICEFEGDRVVVRFEDLVAEVMVDTYLHADETEEGHASWIVSIQRIVHDSISSPYHERGIMEISLSNAPLRVETLRGELIWERP